MLQWVVLLINLYLISFNRTLQSDTPNNTYHCCAGPHIIQLCMNLVDNTPVYNAMHNQSVCDWWETRLVDYRAEQSWANIACRLNHPRSLLCMTWKQILSDSCLPIVQVPLQLPLLWYEAIGLIRAFSRWEVYTQYHNTQPVSQPILFCYDKPMYGILQRLIATRDLIW